MATVAPAPAEQPSEASPSTNEPEVEEEEKESGRKSGKKRYNKKSGVSISAADKNRLREIRGTSVVVLYRSL